MTAFYWMQFYVDPSAVPMDDVVKGATDALVSVGAKFRDSTKHKAIDESVPTIQSRWSHTVGTPSFSEAIGEATRDLKGRPVGSRAQFETYDLGFEMPFEFDQEVIQMLRAHPEVRDENVARKTKLDFILDSDPALKEKIVVDFRAWDEYVHMYGNPATHHRNKKLILMLAEELYTRIHPFYGWADDETNSSDMSYDSLLAGKPPVENEFTFVGPTLRGKIGMAVDLGAGIETKSLTDGGLILHNYGRYPNEQPRFFE